MPEPAAKNLLLLLLSGQRPDLLGSGGHPLVKTPGADRLAAEGTRFERAFTPVALGSPARACLFTGLLPHRNRVLEDCPQRGELPAWLDERLLAWPAALAEAGVRVGHLGDWPLRDATKGPARGFTDWLWLKMKTSDYAREIRERRVPAGNLPGERLPFWAVCRTPPEYTRPAYLVRKAVELLSARAADGERFALVVSFPGPRPPHEIPEPYASMYRPDAVVLPPNLKDEAAGRFPWRRREKPPADGGEIPWEAGAGLDEAAWRRTTAAALGHVTLVDHCVADLLGNLDRLGLMEDTLVVYTSDTGDLGGAHGLFGRGPFLHGEAVRVPLVFRQPGLVAASQVRREFTGLLDLGPTLLAWLGAEEIGPLDGRPFARMLLEDAAPAGWPDAAFGQFHRLAGRPYEMRWIRTEAHAYGFAAAGGEELYDLEKDPGEIANLAHDPATRPVREALRQKLFARLREVSDPLESAGP